MKIHLSFFGLVPPSRMARQTSLTSRAPAAGRKAIGLGLVLMGLASIASASDPIGVYALPEKVVLEPNDAKPERIQIWGVVALAKGRGYEYESPRRGYLYYKLNPAKKEVCLKEWSDLKATAGSGQCLAFGSRYENKGTVRDAKETPKDPDPYPLAFGMTKANDKEYKPIKEILALAGEKKDKPKQPSP